MAEFEFASGFWLLLDDGSRIRFEAGRQTVPDEISGHWYLAAMGTEIEAADPAPSSEEPLPQGEVPERDALKAEAEALGITVDGRWGLDRLRAEIAAKQAPAPE